MTEVGLQCRTNRDLNGVSYSSALNHVVKVTLSTVILHFFLSYLKKVGMYSIGMNLSVGTVMKQGKNTPLLKQIFLKTSLCAQQGMTCMHLYPNRSCHYAHQCQQARNRKSDTRSMQSGSPGREKIQNASEIRKLSTGLDTHLLCKGLSLLPCIQKMIRSRSGGKAVMMWFHSMERVI